MNGVIDTLKFTNSNGEKYNLYPRTLIECITNQDGETLENLLQNQKGGTGSANTICIKGTNLATGLYKVASLPVSAMYGFNSIIGIYGGLSQGDQKAGEEFGLFAINTEKFIKLSGSSSLNDVGVCGLALYLNGTSMNDAIFNLVMTYFNSGSESANQDCTISITTYGEENPWTTFDNNFVAISEDGLGNAVIEQMGEELWKNDLISAIEIIEWSEDFSKDFRVTSGQTEGEIGTYATAEGIYTSAAGYTAHAEGYHTDASESYAHAEGYFTTASNTASHASGKYNKAMTTGAGQSASVGDVFVIGNGTNSSKLSNAFRVTYTGETYGLSAFNSSGADYAEFVYPWHDDNVDNEDRVGYFVTFKDGKLYKATSKDIILGITSGNPSVVGNADEDYYWRYERDEFNRIVFEDVEEEIEKLDENGKPVCDENGQPIYEKTGKIIKNGRMKLNPNYDSSLQNNYVERKDRAEWDYVGMLGILPIRDDGTCIPGQYCKCNDDGIATLATPEDVMTNRFTYIVLERVNDNIIKVRM